MGKKLGGKKDKRIYGEGRFLKRTLTLTSMDLICDWKDSSSSQINNWVQFF